MLYIYLNTHYFLIFFSFFFHQFCNETIKLNNSFKQFHQELQKEWLHLLWNFLRINIKKVCSLANCVESMKHKQEKDLKINKLWRQKVFLSRGLKRIHKKSQQNGWQRKDFCFISEKNSSHLLILFNFCCFLW